jgi:hypothetical protein
MSPFNQADMPRLIRGGGGRALANERKYPHVVELPASAGGLDVELSRRIIEFHNVRHVQPRHGRIISKKRQTYYRWCFSDVRNARAFAEQFGGKTFNARKWLMHGEARRIAANVGQAAGAVRKPSG